MSVSETNKKNKSSVKRRVAISVLIIAFAFGLNITGILPVLGILNEKYQQYGTSAVQLLQTIIYLLLIVGSLMVGWLTTKISKKNITLMGLFIVGCCGVIPFFLESFYFQQPFHQLICKVLIQEMDSLLCNHKLN